MQDLRTIQTKDGRDVVVDLTDVEEVVVRSPSGDKVGNLTLRMIEDPAGDVFLITNMYLDGPNGSREFHGAGVMTQVLSILAEDYGLDIVARPNDGVRRDDQSHLTDEAPVFVAAMVERGLVRYLFD